jgi:hypothetical protein
MPLLDAFAAWCKDEQVKLVEQIQWLEDGEMRLGMRSGDGPWVDITDDELDRLRLNLENVILAIDVYKS